MTGVAVAQAPTRWTPPVGFVWLDGAQFHLGSHRSFWAVDPLDTVTDPAALERYAGRLFLIGYLGYTLRNRWERLPVPYDPPLGFPPMWMGVYDRVWVREGEALWEWRADDRRQEVASLPFPPPTPGGRLRFRRCTVDRATYVADIEWVRAQIRAGEFYQANYTVGIELELTAPPYELYGRLRVKQPTAYGAYLQVDARRAVLSMSPELFLRWDHPRLMTAPMKGTRPRGRTPDEDRALYEELRTSRKDQAENLMIVDLMRNDLGRVARPGTVRVPELFRVEPYPTVWQMISIVTAEARDDVTLTDLLRATFPPGSVTGAPKIRAMELLAEREKAERGVYCGAIGIVFPGRAAVFSVAIRTLVTCDDRGWYGTGGGITIDSDPEREWDEVFWKTRFLWDDLEWHRVWTLAHS